MTRTVFRISVHAPFESNLVWAAGLPSMIRTERDILRGSEYPATHVAAVVAALKRTQPNEVVITVS